MSRETKFWTITSILLGSVAMMMFLMSPTQPTPTVPEPTTSTLVLPPLPDATPSTEPKALFAVGDKVRVDDQEDAVIVEVGEIEPWVQLSTGNIMKSRAYMISITDASGETFFYRVPELILVKK